MSEIDKIKHMVDRFLSWKLPADFHPDAGISFKPAFNEHTAHPMRHEPMGTNLFDATQATAMVRHMLGGLPAPLSRSGDSALVEARKHIKRLYDQLMERGKPDGHSIDEDAALSAAHNWLAEHPEVQQHGLKSWPYG